MKSKARERVNNLQRGTQEAVISSIKKEDRKRRMKSQPTVVGDRIVVPNPEDYGIQRTKNNKLSPKGIGCLFSGEPTIRPNAKFIPGNDARLTSLLVKVEKGEEPVSAIRPEALCFLAEGPVAGYQIINGRLVRVHRANKASRNEEEIEEEVIEL